MSRANSKKEQLLKALDELVAEGRKVSPFSVEKRAGVSNGLARHYDDVMEKILQAKEGLKPSSTSSAKVESLKRRLASAQERAKKQEATKSSLKVENKKLKDVEKVHIDTIAQLTWDLHNQLSQENPLGVVRFR